MLFTGYLTDYLVNSLLTVDDYTALWLLLVSRAVIAALLYLLVMKAARATILDECIQFLFHRRR